MTSRIGLLLLAGALLVGATTVGEGDVVFLVAGCVAGALGLVVPGRISAYIAGTATAMAVAFVVGYHRATPADCSGDCDLGGLSGMIWAAGALLVAAVVVVVLELLRHREASASAEATR